MVPGRIVHLDALPLTASGKVDRQALPLQPASAAGRTAPRDEDETRLAAIWADVLGLDEVGVHEPFFDLGGHSLAAARLLVRIEEALGVPLPPAALYESPTIAELAPRVRSGAPGEASLVVPFRRQGARAPLFCVHGFGGGVGDYRGLAEALGDDQPFYALSAHGLDGRGPADERVEDMAARYLRQVREVQPEGPYRLTGYCLGGVVAYEMARQLHAVGQSVALLALLESHAPRRRGASLPRRVAALARGVPYWVGEYRRLGPSGVAARLRHRGRGIRRRLRGQTVTPIDAELTGLPAPRRRVAEAHLRAIVRYQPEPYDGDLTVFRAAHVTPSQALLGALDPHLGWASLAARIDVRTVSGGHHSVLQPPHVSRLAEGLRACLGEDSGHERSSRVRAEG
jgi:thioesterase domain-containing protein/acyl carrier protein